MTASIVSGLELAGSMLTALRVQADELAARLGRRPALVSVYSGEDAGVRRYLERQRDSAAVAGIAWAGERLDAGASTASAASHIARLAADPATDGIALLFPLPQSLDVAQLLAELPSDKDIDGTHPHNLGMLVAGREDDGLLPCTAMAAIRLAENLAGKLAGRPCTVVGASPRVGRPLAQMLLNREATVTVAHAATRDLAAACRGAEVLFVAAGRPGLVTGAMIRPGAIVVDIGINVVTGNDPAAGRPAVVGDVELSSASATAGVVTAVPDGVGPVTTACLLENVLRAAARVR